MKLISHIPLQTAGIGGKLTHDYLSGKPELHTLYTYTPDIEGLKKAVDVRSGVVVNRTVLVEELYNQYKGLKLSKKLKTNIDALREESTFTITTGHQLNLFTGPLYFIYKIASAIVLAEKMNAEMPDKKFVPVYWMNSEDHDFAEINHFFLHHEKYEWTVKADKYGPTGRMELKGLEPVLQTIREKFSAKFSYDKNFGGILRAYQESKNLSEAHRRIVDLFFGEWGVIILDQDSAALKNEFIPLITREIFEKPSITHVSQTNKELEEKGYNSQVFVREINFFYTGNGQRERIIELDGGYAIADHSIKWTAEEMKEEIQQNAFYFSPNVVTRPLYQEHVLPNIAYIGGPAEVAYWLQYKSNFQSYHTFFPVLLLRDCFLVLPEKQVRKINDLGLDLPDFFGSVDAMIHTYIQSHFREELDLTDVEMKLNEVYQLLSARLEGHGKGLEDMPEAARTKAFNQLQNIRKRMNKDLREKNERQLSVLRTFHQLIFPSGDLQERHDNIYDHTLNTPDFIEKIVSVADPLVGDLKVVIQ